MGTLTPPIDPVSQGGGIETNNRVEPLRSALHSCFVNVMVTIPILGNERETREGGTEKRTRGGRTDRQTDRGYLELVPN